MPIMQIQSEVSKEEVHQMLLYELYELSTQQLLNIIVISIMMSIILSSISFYLLSIDDWLLLIGVASITSLLFILFSCRKVLFPNANHILIIAFGEVRIMEKQTISAFDKINNLKITKGKHQKTKLPMLCIQGNEFPITYISFHKALSQWKSTATWDKVDFMIYSKKEWQKLNKITTNGITNGIT